ncbi:MAG: NosD domain-containing protein [Candidatus Thermoplasmatota archaeon]
MRENKKQIIFLTLCFCVFITNVVAASQHQISSIIHTTCTNDKIIYVDDDNTLGPWDGSIEHPYQTIQEGLSHAESDDTIYVFSGTYYSSGVFNSISLQKPVKLQGEGPQTTVIRGYGAKWVVSINNDQGACSISGFTIENSGTDSHDAGILVSADNSTISNNIIRGNVIGIYFSDSRIQANTQILGNIIEQNNHGIFMWGASHNLIKNNIIRNNRFDGINIIYRDGNVIQLNTISGHTFPSESEGIMIEISRDNFITQNNFLENIRDAYFRNGFCNTWQNNYWNAARKTPKLIFGEFVLSSGPMEPGIRIPLIRIDRNPAQESFNISI